MCVAERITFFLLNHIRVGGFVLKCDETANVTLRPIGKLNIYGFLKSIHLFYMVKCVLNIKENIV